MSSLAEFIKIADIHATRINHAVQHLDKLFPVSSSTVQNISEQDFLLVELLTTRFAKLQDFMGTKLIDSFLEAKGEVVYNMTMIDKINKLERLGVLDDANLWFELREVRNHISHEYPDHPEITASYLNRLFVLTPKLLLFLQNIKERL